MSPAVIAAYIIGIICGVVITIIFACCRLASELDRAEEEREALKRWKDSLKQQREEKKDVEEEDPGELL